jgi:hypothetical protein
VHDHTFSDAGRLNDFMDLTKGVTTVDNRRLVEIYRQPELIGEHLQLLVARRQIAIEVQPNLPDGDSPLGMSDDGGPFDRPPVCFVRVQASRSHDPIGIPVCERDRGGRGSRVYARHHQPIDIGRSLQQDGGFFVGQLQMAVRINPHWGRG